MIRLPADGKPSSILSSLPSSKTTGASKVGPVSMSSAKEAENDVSLSSTARSIQDALRRQQAMSRSALEHLYAASWENNTAFGAFIRSGGAGNPRLLPDTEDNAWLERAQQAIDFAVALNKRPPAAASNPFAGLPRAAVSAIFYDDSGRFTDAERWAASVEMRAQDNAMVERLSSSMRGYDQRTLLKGFLDFYDGLAPVERIKYPDNERQLLQTEYDAQVRRFDGVSLVEQLTQAIQHQPGEGEAEEPTANRPWVRALQQVIEATLQAHPPVDQSPATEAPVSSSMVNSASHR